MLDTALALYNKLLSMYKNQYDKLTKTQKKSIKFQNILENLPMDLDLDEKVTLDPEKTLLFIYAIML